MKNFTFLILFFAFFSSCKKDAELGSILPGTWVSEQVKVSGEDITALSFYEITFGTDTAFTQILTTNLNGVNSKTTKMGSYKIAGNSKITVQFSGENPSDWTAKTDSETDLKVDFSRNGEQFFIDFL